CGCGGCCRRWWTWSSVLPVDEGCLQATGRGNADAELIGQGNGAGVGPVCLRYGEHEGCPVAQVTTWGAYGGDVPHLTPGGDMPAGDAGEGGHLVGAEELVITDHGGGELALLVVGAPVPAERGDASRLVGEGGEGGGQVGVFGDAGTSAEEQFGAAGEVGDAGSGLPGHLGPDGVVPVVAGHAGDLEPHRPVEVPGEVDGGGGAHRVPPLATSRSTSAWHGAVRG